MPAIIYWIGIPLVLLKGGTLLLNGLGAVAGMKFMTRAALFLAMLIATSVWMASSAVIY